MKNEERRMKKGEGVRKPIRSFTDLNVWKEGHGLVLSTYAVTRKFPKEERYALGDQMRRSAVSITSNIAEGFGRQGIKEKIQFYFHAKGSLTELKNQLIIARDVGYIDEGHFREIAAKANATDQLLQGLIRATKKRVSK